MFLFEAPVRGQDIEPVDLTPGEGVTIVASEAAGARREFATDEQVEALMGKYFLMDRRRSALPLGASGDGARVQNLKATLADADPCQAGSDSTR